MVSKRLTVLFMFIAIQLTVIYYMFYSVETSRNDPMVPKSLSGVSLVAKARNSHGRTNRQGKLQEKIKEMLDDKENSIDTETMFQGTSGNRQNHNTNDDLDPTQNEGYERTLLNKTIKESSSSQDLTSTTHKDSSNEDIIKIPLTDFETYPCLSSIRQSVSLRRLGRCVRTVNVTITSQTVPDNHCVNLHLPKPTPICIHDPRTDRIVSAYVFATGIWEKGLVEDFITALDRTPGIAVLDIGCNIGVYTLAAAKAGKRVVSVDANIENLRLLSKSVVLGKFSENVTLIWNAMSSQYANVTLIPAKLNVGGSFIGSKNRNTSENEVLIQTIMLDDLEDLFKDGPVAIKMDVELFEVHVLRGGLLFLRRVDIKFIQIEMLHHRKLESGKILVTILDFFGFKPYRRCVGGASLKTFKVSDFPGDVCFIRTREKPLPLR